MYAFKIMFTTESKQRRSPISPAEWSCPEELTTKNILYTHTQTHTAVTQDKRHFYEIRQVTCRYYAGKFVFVCLLFPELSYYKQLRSVVLCKHYLFALATFNPTYTHIYTPSHRQTHTEGKKTRWVSSEKEASQKSYIQCMVSDSDTLCLSLFVKAPQQVISSEFQWEDPVPLMKQHRWWKAKTIRPCVWHVNKRECAKFPVHRFRSGLDSTWSTYVKKKKKIQDILSGCHSSGSWQKLPVSYLPHSKQIKETI